MSGFSDTELENGKLLDELVNKTAPSEQLEVMAEGAASGMSGSVLNEAKRGRGRPGKVNNIIES